MWHRRELIKTLGAVLLAPGSGLLASYDLLTLRGHVVCTGENHKEGDEHEHVWSFETNDKRVYPLFRALTSEALFEDPEMRKRELQVTGRIHPEKKTFEVFQTRSVKDGRLQDIYYWCEVCSIRSPIPGPCWCCYNPFELREVPLLTEQ